MRKKGLSLFFAVLILGLFISASDQPDNSSANPPEKKIMVAVYPIKVLASDKSFESLGPVLTSFLVTQLTKSTKLKVSEQEMTAEVEKQLEFANSDKCDATMCPIPEIGKALAAQKLVVGQVARLGSKYTANIRVIDIEKKVIDFSVEEKMVGKEEDLDQLMELAALDLREKYGEKVEQPHPSVQAQPGNSVPAASISPELDSQNLLGITVRELTASEIKTWLFGVRVESVLPDSPCKHIFQPGNIITTINPQGPLKFDKSDWDYAVRNINDFRKQVSGIKPGATVGCGVVLGKSALVPGKDYICAIPESQPVAPVRAEEKPAKH